MTNQLSVSRKESAFSLVELLVVIAVIGVMAAIGITALGGIYRNAQTKKDQRNAQTIVSVAMSAHAAGIELATTSKTDLVDQLSEGVTSMVAGSPVVFRLSALSTEEISGASPYIVLEDGYVTYSQTPVP